MEWDMLKLILLTRNKELFIQVRNKKFEGSGRKITTFKALKIAALEFISLKEVFPSWEEFPYDLLKATNKQMEKSRTASA